jgi:hypothetical protein
VLGIVMQIYNSLTSVKSVFIYAYSIFLKLSGFKYEVQLKSTDGLVDVDV